MEEPILGEEPEVEMGEGERGMGKTPDHRCNHGDGLGGVPLQLKFGQGGLVPIRSSKDGAVMPQHVDSTSEPKGGRLFCLPTNNIHMPGYAGACFAKGICAEVCVF